MKQNKYQSGSGHIVIIIALVVVLLGALGFVFWQSSTQSKDSNNTKDKSTISQITTSSQTSLETTLTPNLRSPETVVDEFLSAFFLYMGSSVAEKSDANFVSDRSDITDAYKNRIINPEGLVYASPILLVQDLPSSYSITKVSEISSTNADVWVKLNFASSEKIIAYSLIFVDNAWKIDGVEQN